MTAFVVLLVLIIGLGVASFFGWTADSRDPEYSLGRIVDGPSNAAGR